jgi:integrase
MTVRTVVANFDNSYDGLAYRRAKKLDGLPGSAASSDLAARTVREWGAEWLRRRESSGIRSIRDDRDRWRVHVVDFAPWIDLPLSSVSRALGRDWFELLHQRRSSSPTHRRTSKALAAQTLRNILNLVRKCFADAVEEWAGLGLVLVNPFASLRVHRSRAATTRELSTVVELHEQPIALAALPLPDRFLVMVAMGSGLRKAEQWGLRLADLELDGPRPQMRVRYGTKRDDPTKGGKVKVVALFGMALVGAKAWVEQLASYAPKNPKGLAFPNRDGSRRVGVFYSYRKLGRALGRHVRYHDLRHTCGTSLVGGWWVGEPWGLKAPWTLEAVRSLFGHSSVKVTERYARIAADLALASAERISPLPLNVRSRLAVPVFARAPRARARGKSVQQNNGVDGGESSGENDASPVQGAVAKWLGTGLQNRLGTPVGEGPTGRQTDAKAEMAAAVERTKARLGRGCIAVCCVGGPDEAPCGKRCAREELHPDECRCSVHGGGVPYDPAARHAAAVALETRMGLPTVARSPEPDDEPDLEVERLGFYRGHDARGWAERHDVERERANENARAHFVALKERDEALALGHRRARRIDELVTEHDAARGLIESTLRVVDGLRGEVAHCRKVVREQRSSRPAQSVLGHEDASEAPRKPAVNSAVVARGDVPETAPSPPAEARESRGALSDVARFSKPAELDLERLYAVAGRAAAHCPKELAGELADVLLVRSLSPAPTENEPEETPEHAPGCPYPVDYCTCYTYSAVKPAASPKATLHPLLAAIGAVPAESFKATELGEVPFRERVTVPDLSDADDGEERELLHLGREQLRALAQERTNERDEARRHLREACGLLNDVDRVGVRIACFLDAANKAVRS